jgi:ATP-binding cassette subfamily F protein uup
MSILISCRDLSKRFGARPLFEGLTLGLSDNERTGLIGPNGTGKSTLLKILAGLEPPDKGELAIRRGLKVRYLAQQDFSETGTEGTVREVLTQALKGLGLEDYEVDIRAESGMDEAGFHPDDPVSALSGGRRKRLAILSHILCEPDLLLLDEPTNHLDLEGVLWLERCLSSLRFSFLVVSHDRRFLESVCNRVIELNKRYASGHFSSVGNYSRFVENREALFNVQAAREETTRNVVRREIEWLRRGPKARTTKQKARIDRAGELIEELGELEYRNAQGRTAAIDFSSSRRQTKRFVEGVHIAQSMGGRKLFGPLDFRLGPGDKLGLMGANGSGKSTLLKILSGQWAPDSGSMKRAEGLKVVTFDQHREQLDLALPLRRALCESGEFVYYKNNPIHVAGWAERFLFSKEQLDVPLSRLSGGEQSRVLIARLMLRPADLLLLDEPTNDLDIPSLEVLESSMLEFEGALVLVTHDRYLLDRVSRQILMLDGKGNSRYFADLSQWEEAQAEAETSEAAAPVIAPKNPSPRQGKPAYSAKEAKELKQVEANLRAAETQIKKAKAALEDPSVATDAAELLERTQALHEAERHLEALSARWEQLEALKSS